MDRLTVAAGWMDANSRSSSCEPVEIIVSRYLAKLKNDKLDRSKKIDV